MKELKEKRKPCFKIYNISFLVKRNYFISTEMRNKPCFNENTGIEVKYFIIETLRQVSLFL